MSVDDLAKKIGKSRATLYRYENDETADIPANVFPQLAKVFSVPPNYFLGWSDDVGIYEDPKLAVSDNSFAVSSYTTDNAVAQISVFTKSTNCNQIILKKADNSLQVFDLTNEEFTAIQVLLGSLKK